MATDRKKVTLERLIDAREQLHDLQEWLGHVDEALMRAIAENDGNAISIFWASHAVTKLQGVYNEIARCNGAALVRSSKGDGTS